MRKLIRIKCVILTNVSTTKGVVKMNRNKFLSIMLGLMLLSTAFVGIGKSASADDFSEQTISFSKSENLEFGNYRVETIRRMMKWRIMPQ